MKHSNFKHLHEIWEIMWTPCTHDILHKFYVYNYALEEVLNEDMNGTILP